MAATWARSLAAPLGFYATVVAAMFAYRVIPWVGGADPVRDLAAGMVLTTAQPAAMLAFLTLWPCSRMSQLSWVPVAFSIIVMIALGAMMAFDPPEQPRMPPSMPTQVWRLCNVTLHVLVQWMLWHWLLATGTRTAAVLVGVAIVVHATTILGEYVVCNLIPVRPGPSLSDRSASACVRAGIGWTFAVVGAASLLLAAGLAILRERLRS